MTKVKVYVDDTLHTKDVEKEINDLGATFEIINVAVSSVLAEEWRIINTYVVTYKDKEQA